jgi:HEAT repeat protein
MRRAAFLGLLTASLALAGRAEAQPAAASKAAIAAAGGLDAVEASVDPVGRSLHFATGKTQGDVAVDLEDADGAKATVSPVAIGDGRRVLHVKVPSKARPDVAWEALVAGREQAVLWSGATGLAHGEEGERAGEALEVPEGGASATSATGYVLVGEVREDLRICGQDLTLLSPRALDPKTLAFRGASMQRLPADERQDAERVVASLHGGPAEAPLAKLLLATGASTAIGAPSALTDGDPTTAWSEGRPGDGHGEFVTMRAPSDVPIARLAITVAPAGGVLPAHGAAPRTFFLVTDTRTIAVTMPEDAWMHPGNAYDVALVDPLKASCVSLVLDKAYARGADPHPEVAIAELTAYSQLDHPGATLDEVAKALSGGGARADAAKGVLERAGDAGLAAASAVFASLDAQGRALAIDAAISAGTCEASAPILLAATADRDPEVARKGREKLERCGKRASAALVAAVRGPDMAARATAAPLLAEVAPSEAVDPLADALAQGDAATRATVRAALAKAVRSASPAKLDALLQDARRSADARLELLRALQDRLPDVTASADAAIDALASGAGEMRTRYLLVGPLASLARAGDAASSARLAKAVTGDPDDAVRAHAAESAGGIGTLAAVLAAIDDRAPRVREAALRTIAAVEGTKPAPPVDAIAGRLASDEWTFVRAAAAAALASFAPDARVDAALAQALGDRAPTVRAQAIAALAAHGARGAAKAIRDRLDDAHEELEARVAAARALAALCDRASVDSLTKLAINGALPMAKEDEMTLGLEAIKALGELRPADLAKRLGPLSASDVSAEMKAAVARAMADPDGGRCQ